MHTKQFAPKNGEMGVIWMLCMDRHTATADANHTTHTHTIEP